ncbi:MAG: endonuclease domain-containing protein [Candidatus Cyclobacteriaceae bacterium M2_1C_046]
MNGKDMFYGASANIFSNAKELREKQTPEEQILWEKLSNKKLNGFKFRRQHPIASYIADFYCHKAKLVIELDGLIHETSENKNYDHGRDAELRAFGLKVLRFKNSEVTENMDNVLHEIERALFG